VARKRRTFPARSLAAFCRRYLAWYANVNYDLQTNGETFVLDRLAHFDPTVLFDVGANLGDWTAAARTLCPGAAVHAFEISPPTFTRLAARFSSDPLVHLNPAGLSDSEGTIEIRHYEGLEALTTAVDYPHPFPFQTLRARVTTGAAYAASCGVQHIDLLKIDVEGMEEQVLAGFDPLFQRQAIDLVQFEYGRVSILTGFLLRHFYCFFEQRGFLVGKIYPEYVDFRAYSMEDEDFLGPNYLACRRDKPEYLQALRGRL
jgi:FkbM family methyltransferase